MKIRSLLFILCLCGAPAIGKQEAFYLGTYTDHSSSQGIYRGTLDTVTGKLGPLILSARAVDPSFLALRPDGRILYAAEETPGTGSVEAFRRGNDGRLLSLNRQSANGNGTCHVSVDLTGRNVLAANYGSGNIACFQLRKNGSISTRTAFVQFTGSGPDADRQAAPHAHSVYVSPDNAFVYSCDLGSDRIWIFKFDAAKGTLVANDPPFAQVPPGSGARHLVFGRGGSTVYVSNEMGRSVSIFARNPTTGNLTPLQTISSSLPGTPDAKAATAEVVLHPTGKWLYVSNRGSNTLSAFAIDPSGRLKFIQSLSAGVDSPRSFAIDPSGHWLIAAGQNDNRIAVLKIDSANGELSATAESAPAGSPVCVLFEIEK
jgi:6-phosphogluconolactonase